MLFFLYTFAGLSAMNSNLLSAFVTPVCGICPVLTTRTNNREFVILSVIDYVVYYKS